MPVITNAVYLNKDNFFSPKGIFSLMNNFYSAGVIQRSCRKNRDVSSGKVREFDFQFRFEILSRIFPEHEASFLYFTKISKQRVNS